jgi:hypothetical protein
MANRLSIKTLTDAELWAARLPDQHIAVELQQSAQLHERIKVFEAVIWFPHLRAQVNGSDSRGMSGTCRGFKVMTWCCAGRCLIQIERTGARVTLITADDEKPWRRDTAHMVPPMGPMGLQSIDAEFLDALAMLYEVTRYGGEIVLTPDPDVTIG